MPAPSLPQTLTLPGPNVEVGKCPECEASIKIADVWFQRFSELLARVNKNTRDINDIQGILNP